MSEAQSGRDPYYKVVELTDVTDERMEEVINEWVGQGYRLESVHFAMRESSRRPSMAFLLFIGAKPDDA